MRRALVTFAGVLVLALAGAAPALAEVPSWQISSEVVPSYLPPGGEGEINLVVSNLGDGPVNGGTGSPVILTDELPAGLTATAITGASMKCSLAVLQCTFTGNLVPYRGLAVTIKVKVEEPTGTVTSLPDEVSVEGGGALSTSSVQRVTVSGEATPFGVQGYELSPLNEDGTPATQAGSHPFELTTTLVLNQTVRRGYPQPLALPKDLRFNLPPGLIGDPNAVAQCTLTDFSAYVLETNLCPPSSVVGVAKVRVYEPFLGVPTLTVPVFNLVPARGEPARFGFEVLGKVPVVIDTSVRTGGDYGVVASVENATEAGALLSSQVTLWGVPGDPRHDSSRGWECVAGGFFQDEIGNRPCPTSSELPQTPFLTLPTSCPSDPASEPLTSSMEVDSWAAPGSFLSSEYAWLNGSGEPLGLEGCQQLPFAPTIQLTPEEAHGAPVHSASTPTGLSVNVQVPQTAILEPNPEGRAEADVRDTTVRLPEGVQLSPSAANGLTACSEEQIGYERLEANTETQEFKPTKSTPTQPLCPEASKVGVVHIKTPLLPNELEGALYLAEPAPNGEAGKNPFDSLVALYLVAEDPVSGVLVKLAGKGELNPTTGRVSTSFQNTPQLPFEDLKIELFGGQRASLTTPAFCGDPPTEALFTPWSDTGPVDALSALEITSSVGGGACPSGPLAFSPSFDAQSTNAQAGAFTPFTLEIERPDGEQALTGVTVHLPEGVAALLSSLTPCQEPPAGQEWACGPESEIGQSTASSGLGSEPVVLPGEVYLTSGYDGAPFGLLVRTKAEAGPFDLGYVNVRSRINVNPETAAVTITTDPGPRGEALITILKGIPVQLKRLLVTVDRPDFEFNPTSCAPMAITGSLSGSEGASATVSSRFQVGGCESLPFHPTLEASTQGQASKADGASLDVKVTSQGLGVANIQKVFLTIPRILPSRLQPTLQHACLAAVFEANPAGCDEDSLIGYATVRTPILKSPLTGPAYVVSHGGAAFPDVEFVLQGEGITLILDGHTQIKNGVTYSRFESTPDAPFTSFETVLPEGPHSVLAVNTEEAPNYSLCGHNITIPTTITAQDGAVLEQTTKVGVTGCGAVKSFKAKLTRAQQLAKAVSACRHKYTKKSQKRKRLTCEKTARERYAAKKKAHKAKTTASHSRRR